MTKDFIHKVDKAKIPVCNIMGINIAAINMDWLLNFTDRFIKDLSGDYMCVSNVHTIIMGSESPNYRSIQNNAIMSIPDGGPLSALGKKRGHKEMERTAGPSYMEKIFSTTASKGYRHYFYGSTEETLNKLNLKLKEAYPGIKIAGMYSPPFRPIMEEEDKIIIKRINDTNPDFIWVGLGAPKQEIWMAVHQGKIKGFMVGVGAGFDYFAGNIKRAPIWMQKTNMEWFYRLLQDPVRLFGRYWHTNLKFIWNVVIRKQ